MKTIQKIFVIIYNVWAVYWGCVFTYTTIHNVRTIEFDGMYATINTTDMYLLVLFCIFTAIMAISLFTSSVFLIYNIFCKTYSLKHFILSVIWLTVNIICLFAIHNINYKTLEFIVRLKVFSIFSIDLFSNRKLSFILSLIMSKYVLCAISGINIVLSLIRIRREKKSK